MNGPSSSFHQSTHGRHKHNQSLPKIRKAKSQSFRTRRSPSDRRSPINSQGPLTLNAMLTTNDNKGLSPHTPKSPILPHPESKSPGSVSQKTPTTLSRQGTLRASHKRKSSMTGSLSLAQGRKSPVGFNNDRSPQGRRSPLLSSNDRLKSPNELPLHLGFGSTTPILRSPTGDRRSPTFSIHTQERRSPVGSAAPMDFSQITRRSPTSTVHVQDGTRTTTCDASTEPEDAHTPTSYKRPSINLFTPIYFSGDKRSPMGPIPPITVSNPAETYRIAESANTEKSAEIQIELEQRQREEKEKAEAKSTSEPKDQQQPEKKSVMREILAFVRKPSKHISTRTNRFANAFTRAESGTSSGPLIRQSTFSASPAASSTAAKSAVVKQMSEVGFEPKMSLKFSHYAKMSLKLRRSARDEEKSKQQQQQSNSNDSKRPSSDSTGTSSGGGSSGGVGQLNIQEGSGSGRATPLSDIPFELANVHFEKVGESYIKHDKKLEDEDGAEDVIDPTTDNILANLVEEINNSLKISSLTTENSGAVHHFQRRSESREPIEPRISEERESDSNDLIIPEDFRSELVEILKGYKPEPIYVNLSDLKKETEEAVEAAQKALEAATLGSSIEKSPMQCPIIEFEPPSRRSSFDPPRSPFLETLRSPGGDTDVSLQRHESGGDSFEMVEGDRKSSRAESSFECPYSSRETSFDISRYQSTSYEDQSSSFEIVDMDEKVKKSSIDLRKSSIELLDAETFQRSNSSNGRKSSLETHFDYTPSEASGGGVGITVASMSINTVRSTNFPLTKKQKAETFRSLHISPFSAFSRARSPLSNQTSSNYSSRDSYDSSSSSVPPHHEPPQRSPFADPTKKHFPLTIKQKEEEVKTFLCTDQRCASIFEPRPSSVLTQQFSTGSMSTPSGYANGTPRALSNTGGGSFGFGGFSSGSEFDPPSPRRATSASPKHTFTFRIVLKKVDSSPEALCPERHRSRIIDRYRRRDSRRRRLQTVGKSV